MCYDWEAEALKTKRERERNMYKVSVLAGTPVDTQMGVDFLNGKNAGAAEDMLVEPLYRPVA